jgi:hypothetical protein
MPSLRPGLPRRVCQVSWDSFPLSSAGHATELEAAEEREAVEAGLEPAEEPEAAEAGLEPAGMQPKAVHRPYWWP